MVSSKPNVSELPIEGKNFQFYNGIEGYFINWKFVFATERVLENDVLKQTPKLIAGVIDHIFNS